MFGLVWLLVCGPLASGSHLADKYRNSHFPKFVTTSYFDNLLPQQG